VFCVTKTFKFEAAHFLPNHDGKCRRVHGHSYVVEVELSGPSLTASGPKEGMLIDFSDLSDWWRQEVDSALDHRLLNEVLVDDYFPPTAEMIAKCIFDMAWKRFAPLVTAVTVYETATSKARYTRD
jgi:6-pyruvoyltetrahydropterin/6-carboxytetrahydropterin synthase